MKAKYFIIIPIITFIISISCLIYSCIDKENKPKIACTKECEIFDCREIRKFSFENHSYIFIRNTWSCSGDSYLHDPNCQCLNKEVK